jgi:hypothetical protein
MKVDRQTLTSLLANTKHAGQVDGVLVISIPELMTLYATGEAAAVAVLETILRWPLGLDAYSMMAHVLAQKPEEIELFNRRLT